jgi:hypothetical protein
MFWIVATLIAGYIAAIFTWPKLRTWVAIDAKIDSLREKARVLAAKIKTFIGS